MAEEVTTRLSRKNTTNEQRQAIFESLLKRSVNGKLKRNTTFEVAQLFSVNMRTVQRIWQRGKENEVLDSNANVSSKKPLNCGRKRLQIDVNQFRNIPLRRRTTLRSLSAVTNLSVPTLFRRLKDGSIRHHSNAIKPVLKVENMKARIRFCLSMIEQGNNPSCLRFITMENIIHVDEKWFYMTKHSQKYYLLPDEDEPLRTCKSKSFITKVMFMAAVTRPRFDESGNELFSGKIGIFPFINKEPAMRNSKNRVAGTMETKTITSINKEIYRSYIVEKLLPAIRDKWPRMDARSPIFIQQDNAKPHIGLDGEYFQSNATKDGFDIRLISQPPNSPVMNVLDLGFFNAIQALQHQQAPNSVDALKEAVQKSFDEYSPTKLNHTFLTLQSCMISILETGGSNKYKVPHMKKHSLERQNRLPKQLDVDLVLIEEAITQCQ